MIPKSERLHWTQEMKYLRAVAEVLSDLGYSVEEPCTKHRDLLDVWGEFNGKECFHEIYVTTYKCHGGIHGVWTVDYEDQDELIECFLSPDGILYSSDLESAVLRALNPYKKKRTA